MALFLSFVAGVMKPSSHVVAAPVGYSRQALHFMVEATRETVQRWQRMQSGRKHDARLRPHWTQPLSQAVWRLQPIHITGENHHT